jgi:hypothetical protein
VRLAWLAAKTRQLVGIVMLVVSVPAITAGVIEWRRGSALRPLAAIYSVAGFYLAYEGLRLVRGK